MGYIKPDDVAWAEVVLYSRVWVGEEMWEFGNMVAFDPEQLNDDLWMAITTELETSVKGAVARKSLGGELPVVWGPLEWMAREVTHEEVEWAKREHPEAFEEQDA